MVRFKNIVKSTLRHFPSSNFLARDNKKILNLFIHLKVISRNKCATTFLLK